MATPCPRYAAAMHEASHDPSVHASSMHGSFVHDAAAEPHAKRDAGGALVAILRELPELVPLPFWANAPLCGRSQVYKTPHQFTWTTVRGVGHMARLFQPLRLLDLFDRFIHKKAI